MEKRMEWLDILKGITVLLVVLGHSRVEMNYMSRLCVGAHMPIFFMAGGITLHKYDTFQKGILKKAQSLIYPYLTCSFLYLCVYGLYSLWIKEDMTGFWKMLTLSLRFEGYGVLWFLPTLFLAEIILLMFIHTGLSKKMIVIIYAIIIISVRTLGGGYGTERWYLCILERTLFAGIFVLAGYVLQERLISREIPYWVFIITLGLYAYLCYNMQEWFAFDLHYAVLPNLFTYYLLGALGIGAILSLSMRLKSKFFVWVGRNSLCVMCTHYPILFWIWQRVFRLQLHPLVHQLLVAGIVILIEIVLIWFVNKRFRILFYCPARKC